MNDLKEFWFIRHAESEGNAGLPTPSAGGIPLTERGHLQASLLADHIQEPPDLFVISPFIRTRQTAEPTLRKFPDVPVETWAIEEYTYLPAAQYRNTTTAQRNKPAVDYFRAADPDLNLGDGAESFNQMINRVDAAFEKINHDPHQKIYLFSHGWYMRALLWRMIFLPGYGSTLNLDNLKDKLPRTGFFYKIFSKFGKNIGSNPINHFLIFSSVVSIPNASILKLTMDLKTQEIQFNELDGSHIPEDLRSTHIGNR